MTTDHARFLTQFPGRHTFQTFDDRSDKDRQLSRVLHNPAELNDLNRRGAGVFLMPNEGDSKGRKKSNVTRIRAYFADFDGAALPQEWALEPCLIVETSPGKFHAYWILQQGEMPPLDNAAFNRQQEAIARAVGSQPDDCKGLNRVMRMPGYLHQKSAPFLSRTVWNTDKRFTVEQIRAAYPVPVRTTLTVERPAAQAKHGGPLTLAEMRRKYALAALHKLADELSNTPEGGRNTLLNKASYRAGRLVSGGHLERDEVEVELMQAGQRAGLSVQEIQPTFLNGLMAGMADPDPLEQVGLPRIYTSHHTASPSGGSVGDERGRSFAPTHQTLGNGAMVRGSPENLALSKYRAKLGRKYGGLL